MHFYNGDLSRHIFYFPKNKFLTKKCTQNHNHRFYMEMDWHLANKFFRRKTMSDKLQMEEMEAEAPIRGIKLNHPGRKLLLGRTKCQNSGSVVFTSHLQAIQAVQQQHVAEQALRTQLLQQQFSNSNSSSIKKVHPLQRQFLRSRSAFIRPVR